MGKISKVTPGPTYSINYDDGDREEEVAEKRIRTQAEGDAERAADHTSTYKKGDNIEAQYRQGSTWYGGVIDKVSWGEVRHLVQ